MKTKKMFSMLLALCLLLALLPTAAFATGTGKAIRPVGKSGAAPAAGNIAGAQASSVYFGTYPQSSDGNGGYNDDPIKWRVLQNADGHLLLLSDQNLDAVQYNTNRTSVTWETSTIRSWLNGYGSAVNQAGTDYSVSPAASFLGTAFTTGEQASIPAVTVVNDNSPKYGTAGGNNTTDKLFLLSIAEATTTGFGFTDNDSDTDVRKAGNTDYAKSRGIYTNSSTGCGDWWLRSPGGDDDYAAIFDDEGALDSIGHSVNYYYVAVRPAFHIDLNSVLFTSAANGGKAGEGALAPVGEYSGSDWKLTLLDDGSQYAVGDGHKDFKAEIVGTDGDPWKWKIQYSGAKAGENEYISAVIYGELDGYYGLLYYGRLCKAQADPADPEAEPNTITVDLSDMPLDDNESSGWNELYLFNEQYNGDYKTDYASGLQLIKAPTIMTIDAQTVSVGEDAVIIAHLPDPATGPVTLTVNGTLYTVDTTDGRAVLTISGLDAGTYTVEASYSGDDYFTGCTASAELTVSPAAPAEVSTWTELQAALSAGGDIVLTADVVPDDPFWADSLSVPDGVTATLDLNGHVVDRGLTEVTEWGGHVIEVAGTLTVTDGDPTAEHTTPVTYVDPITGDTVTVSGGVITGGFTDQYGGGVYIKGGTFNLEGGSIVGNQVGKSGMFGAMEGLGGGVYMQTGAFTMSGGAVSGNKAVNQNTMIQEMQGKGGGVYVNGGTFTMSGGTVSGNEAGRRGGGVYLASEYSGHSGSLVSGGATVTGNAVGSAANNVYLEDGGALSVADTLTGTVGVTMMTPGVFTSGLSGRGTKENFKSDDAGLVISLTDAGEAQLTEKHIYSVTVTPGSNMTLSSGTEVQTDLTGAMTDVVYTADDGYYFPLEYVSSIAPTSVTITRNSDTQLTISGTPTADETIVLPAATEYLYPLWVGGVQVTGSNKDDITSAINAAAGSNVASGTASLSLNAYGYTGDKPLHYDLTLTLTDFVYTGQGYEFETGKYAAVYFKGNGERGEGFYPKFYADGELIVDVNGECSITQQLDDPAASVSECYGIYAYSGGNRDTGLYFQNSGSLTVAVGNNGAKNKASGIYVYGHCYAHGANLTCVGPSAGATVSSGITLYSRTYFLCARNGGAITASGTNYAVRDATSGSDYSFILYNTDDYSLIVGANADGSGAAGYTGATTVDGSDTRVSGKDLASYKYVAIKQPSFTVTIIPGEHMTLSSGSESQTGLTGAMTDVVYTADGGFYFPEDYAVASVNGVTVTRDSFTRITVFGTPTADASITLPDPTAKVKEPTPTATFTATGPDTGTLANVTAGMTYAIDGGAATAITGTSVDLTGLAPCTITVVQPGNGTTTIDSEAQSIDVTKAETPNLTATQPSIIGGTGSIPTTAAHEFSEDGTTWTDCTGETTGLAAGTYFIRVKAAGTVLASEAQEIEIVAFVPTQEPTPSATFTATGPDSGTLSGVSAGMIYAIDGGAAVNITAATVDLTGLAPCTLTVIQPGNGTTTIDSEAQSITVTKATTPDSVAAEDCITYANNNGKLTGVTAAMEYKKSDADAWTVGTGDDVTGLVPGTYLVRAAAAGTLLASDTQELTVAAYVAPPSDDDWAPALVTEVKSGATITSSELDRLIREGKTLTVEAENGTKVELSNDALKDISGQTSGSIRIDFTKETPAGTDGTDETDAKTAYDLTVSAGGKPVDFDGKVDVIPAGSADASSAPVRTASITAPDGSRHFVVSSEPFPYTDVPAGSYYYDAVNWADLMGITKGAAPYLFSPNGSCTRAQMVTFLWRAAGQPEPTATENPFSDLDEDAYYYKAVLWAAENGITVGTGDGKFDPDGTVTRAQSVTFLFRALHGSAAAGSGFADVNPDAYYYAAVLWAAENGITLGTGDGKFSPDDDCLRAQIVTFLYRAYSEK